MSEMLRTLVHHLGPHFLFKPNRFRNDIPRFVFEAQEEVVGVVRPDVSVLLDPFNVGGAVFKGVPQEGMRVWRSLGEMDGVRLLGRIDGDTLFSLSRVEEPVVDQSSSPSAEAAMGSILSDSLGFGFHCILP